MGGGGGVKMARWSNADDTQRQKNKNDCEPNLLRGRQQMMIVDNVCTSLSTPYGGPDGTQPFICSLQ